MELNLNKKLADDKDIDILRKEELIEGFSLLNDEYKDVFLNILKENSVKNYKEYFLEENYLELISLNQNIEENFYTMSLIQTYMLRKFKTNKKDA